MNFQLLSERARAYNAELWEQVFGPRPSNKTLGEIHTELSKKHGEDTRIEIEKHLAANQTPLQNETH